MAYKRRLGWRKLPTDVFVCAIFLLKRGISTPHPLHPTYATLSSHDTPFHTLSLWCGPRAHRHPWHWFTRIHGVRKETLTISTPAVRPWCPPWRGWRTRRRRRRRRFISMLNIRMSRTPIEGSPVPGCLTPGRAHILMWSRFVPGTTKCLHPNRRHRSYQGLPSGQESAARAAACRISGGMRA